MAQPMQQMNTGDPAMAGGVSDKDWTMMLLLAILLGGLGIDRMVAGSIGLGVLKLITFGGCSVWWLVDIIMLVTGSYKDGNGLPIVKQ
ncbi:MAG: TM2 domain-containing protein [Candidatus Thermoplasmatota archaeon]|nr:TM2 domain-containing protein [Candidatus Thermoplasmatota archaeon]